MTEAVHFLLVPMVMSRSLVLLYDGVWLALHAVLCEGNEFRLKNLSLVPPPVNITFPGASQFSVDFVKFSLWLGPWLAA